MFNLDTPSENQLSRVTRFSGWYLPTREEQGSLNLYFNGQPYVSLQQGLDRPDVALAFPQEPLSLSSGFVGDLLLPTSSSLGDEVEIEIISESNTKKSLLKEKFFIANNDNLYNPLSKSFNITDLLLIPKENLELSIKKLSFKKSHANVCLRGNTIHILQQNDLPIIKISETQSTNPYSQKILEILEEVKDGIVLDFGAGNPPKDCLKGNICYLDAIQYKDTDIVCTTLDLPFKDNSFDAIVSKAVFEHIPNPFITAKELYRILKPGGIIYIATAFMQPLHGDPSHYFNMTLPALRLIMSDFQELESGIDLRQYPSFGLKMQIQAVLPYIKTGTWKTRLQEFYQLLGSEGNQLDEDLGEKGREILAAGVYYKGKKN